MTAKNCPVCGEMTLLEKQGDFRMDLPPNVPGGFVIVPNATWLHCESCGEDILSAELERAINSHCHEVSRAG